MIPQKTGSSPLYCNFCGKVQYAVKKLIAGGMGGWTFCICDECVMLSYEIIRQEDITNARKKLELAELDRDNNHYFGKTSN